MATKERLHKLVDELTDSEIEPVTEILSARCNDAANPEAVRPLLDTPRAAVPRRAHGRMRRRDAR